MKTVFWIIFIVSILIYSSNPVISFKPFSLSFETPALPFAISFLAISIILFQYQSRRDTKTELIKTLYAEGVEDGFNAAIGELKKQEKEIKDNNCKDKVE